MIIKGQEIKIAEIKNFAKETLMAAGKIAKDYFRGSFDTKIKADESIVTIADEEIEQFIRQQINTKFSNHNILGEEQGGSLSADNYNWVIDPIDGTASFQAGKPSFTILLALYNGFEPIFGAIYQPITDELMLAIDGNLYFNDKIIEPKIAKDNKITLATTSPDLLDESGKKHFSELASEYKNVVYGGDAYNYLLLALGHVDCIYEQDLKLHDFLPLLPILNAANANFTNIEGNKVNGDYKGREFLAKK